MKRCHYNVENKETMHFVEEEIEKAKLYLHPCIIEKLLEEKALLFSNIINMNKIDEIQKTVVQLQVTHLRIPNKFIRGVVEENMEGQNKGVCLCVCVCECVGGLGRHMVTYLNYLFPIWS